MHGKRNAINFFSYYTLLFAFCITSFAERYYIFDEWTFDRHYVIVWRYFTVDIVIKWEKQPLAWFILFRYYVFQRGYIGF